MVCARKNSRKASMRKNRKNTRKNRKNTRRNMYGGNPMALSLAQGREFAEIHKEQHGGGALMGAPVGYTGVLDESLRASARVTPLDQSISAIQGMRDVEAPAVEQTGGRRRASRKTSRKNRKNARKASRKNSRKNMHKNSRKEMRKNSRKDMRKNSRKASRKNYRRNNMFGGSAPIDAPSELLSAAMRMKAGTADFSNPLLLK